jgi:hypothetical protein
LTTDDGTVELPVVPEVPVLEPPVLIMTSPGVVDPEGVVWATAAPPMSMVAPIERPTPFTANDLIELGAVNRALKPNPNCRSDMVFNLNSVDELIVIVSTFD